MRQLRGIVRNIQSAGAFRENIGAHKADVGGAERWAEVREGERRFEEVSGGAER
jgi:hypothetical protein